MLDLEAFKKLPPDEQQRELAAADRRLKATQKFFAMCDRLSRLKDAELKAIQARNDHEIAMAAAHDECIAAQEAGGDPRLVPPWLDSLYGRKRHNKE